MVDRSYIRLTILFYVQHINSVHCKSLSLCLCDKDQQNNHTICRDTFYLVVVCILISIYNVGLRHTSIIFTKKMLYNDDNIFSNIAIEKLRVRDHLHRRQL